MLSSDVFHVSWLCKESEAEGEVKGLLKGKREAVHAAFRRRFPQTGEPPDLNSIEQPGLLEELLFAVMEAGSAEEAQGAIRRVVAK